MTPGQRLRKCLHDLHRHGSRAGTMHADVTLRLAHDAMDALEARLEFVAARAMEYRSERDAAREELERLRAEVESLRGLQPRGDTQP